MTVAIDSSRRDSASLNGCFSDTDNKRSGRGGPPAGFWSGGISKEGPPSGRALASRFTAAGGLSFAHVVAFCASLLQDDRALRGERELAVASRAGRHRQRTTDFNVDRATRRVNPQRQKSELEPVALEAWLRVDNPFVSRCRLMNEPELDVVNRVRAGRRDTSAAAGARPGTRSRAAARPGCGSAPPAPLPGLEPDPTPPPRPTALGASRASRLIRTMSQEPSASAQTESRITGVPI